jgi:hypothetical protein
VTEGRGTVMVPPAMNAMSTLKTVVAEHERQTD